MLKIKNDVNLEKELVEKRGFEHVVNKLSKCDIYTIGNNFNSCIDIYSKDRIIICGASDNGFNHEEVLYDLILSGLVEKVI